MSADLSHVSAGYQTVTPSLTAKDAAAAIRFYEQAFGAVLTFKMTDPKTGGTAHAEFRIGNSMLMISDEYPKFGCLTPAEGRGGGFMIYVPDVDSAYEQALAAGASEIDRPADQFWGDRTGRVGDPFGYRWTLAQKIKDVPEEEIARLAADWQG